MPKRRTDDVVHVVMTDHFIQRRAPGRDLLAPLKETHDSPRTSYRGEVVALYPAAVDELDLAVAQVVDGSNLENGIGRLEQALKARRPAQAEYYCELADAYLKANQNSRAIPYYEQALRLKARYPAARRNYALALERMGRWPAAVKLLEPLEDAASLNQLGEAWLQMGQPDRAVASLRRVQLEPDLPEAYVNLGAALVRKEDRSGAADAFRSAILHRPNSAAAHMNLAAILDQAGDFDMAEYHFLRAIRGDPESAMAHFNYGRALVSRSRLEDAERELRTALRIEPKFAEAATSLGLALARRGQAGAAIEQYRYALQLKPEMAAAHFNLALILAGQGKTAEARQHLETVVRTDPSDFQAHLYLGRILLGFGEKEAGLAHLRKALESPRADIRAAAREAMH